ncbi:hypothetical protein LCGC14_0195210 [marine sediment metagenome]|uniref:Uncharacterized protein n=1 Tax=marine sediment metagenome TaxID=412755 RepID=A0A0F9XNA9_9ZZZZ
MPKLIQNIQTYKCEKCNETGTHDEITKHEEDICFSEILTCDYNLKYNVKNFINQYKMYVHTHEDFRKIQACNSAFQRKKDNLKAFEGLLKCAKGHKIILFSGDTTEYDYFYGDIKFTCSGGCEDIRIDLEALHIETDYHNAFHMLRYDLTGSIDAHFYKKERK